MGKLVSTSFPALYIYEIYGGSISSVFRDLRVSVWQEERRRASTVGWLLPQEGSPSTSQARESAQGPPAQTCRSWTKGTIIIQTLLSRNRRIGCLMKHCCRSIAGRETQECSYQMPSSADGESEPVILFDGWKINSCQIWFAVFISSDRSLLVLYIFWYVWRRDVSQWLYWLVLSQNIKPNICYPKYRDSI